MAKLYSENSLKRSKTKGPKKETIKFLLDYSKGYKVVKGKRNTFGFLLN